MKLSQSKPTISAVLLSCTLLFSLNSSANEVTLEQSVVEVVQSQGQKVARDISAQLSNSISAELQRFSTRYNKVQTHNLVAVLKPSKSRQLKPQTLEE